MTFQSGKFLRSLYRQRVSENTCPSLRAFAGQLKIPASLLSYILNGQRLMTANTLAKIAASRALTQQEFKKLSKLHAADRQQRQQSHETYKNSNLQFHEVNEDQLKILQQWQHSAILSLAATPRFNWAPESLSKRLGVPVFQIEDCLARLERFGFIRRNGAGGELLSTNFTSAVDVPSATIREIHRQNLELAAKALENVSVQQRDFSSFCFAFDPSELKSAKKELETMRRRFVKKFSRSAKRNQVYTIAMQFFPLTKLNVHELPKEPSV